jgi:hypothetical protein
MAGEATPINRRFPNKEGETQFEIKITNVQQQHIQT